MSALVAKVDWHPWGQSGSTAHPVAVGVGVADLLARERAVLVAEHRDVGVRRRGVREEVGRGDAFWRFGRGRDAQKEGRRCAQRENCVSG